VKKSLFFLLFTALTITSLVMAPASQAQTQPWSGVCVGTGNASDVATIQGIQCLLANVLSVAITGIGLAGFVMIIIGAFKYLLSGGSPKATESARQTITFTVVGIVVTLSAFIILNIIQAFTGIDATILTRFAIPGPDTGLPGQNDSP